MRTVFSLIFLFFFIALRAQPDTTQKVVEGRRNSPGQQQKPYVILISVDGFRYDYAEKHGATFLQRVGRTETKAAYLQPSFPTLTFPNHYTLVTGLYPAHHGLVDNQFYDRGTGEDYSMRKSNRVRSERWYGGLPLWVLAEQQQMLSASFYWVGTEAPIRQTLPTYYYHYNESIPINRRIEAVENWLQLPADRRPHLITFYFPEVDHAGHSYGPDAPQTGLAVRQVDSALQQLTEAVNRTGLAVNFILVSDHGMAAVDTLRPLYMPPIDSAKAIVLRGGEQAHIYVKKKEDIKPLYKALKAGATNYTVTLKKKMPRRLHYGAKDDWFNRIGDIYLQSNWPQVFVSPGARVKPGAHGFDVDKVPDMRAVFYAWGPAFKKNNITGPIRNIDVYPLVASVLGLPFTQAIDGKKKRAKNVLAEK